MGVRIITDSTSEISQNQAGALNISVVPIKSVFSDREYRDGIDLTTEEFYEKLEEAETLPTTSQPSPGDFEAIYREALAVGDQVVVATISSKLSGTWQSACIARDSLAGEGTLKDGDIHVVDSENTTIGLNILMQRALQMRDKGMNAKEIADDLEKAKSEIRLYAVVDTLEYLHRGGRLSTASKVAGTLLNVKPLITVDQGEVKVVGKCRGLKKAYDEMYDLVAKAGGIDFGAPFAMGYTGDRHRFAQFEEMSKEHLGKHSPTIVGIGCAIGTHVGPGAVAIAFFVQ
ncbi:MAG: DegV family protein [Coriobacteriia bacterium]|nr:DegV family protein [Coriobacteriia bacterium]MCL2746403.1 DegV family protein [Coriobacteriia bacterium]MCL2871002.1 DegV family protein [Coriobacteriia bacterium]